MKKKRIFTPSDPAYRWIQCPDIGRRQFLKTVTLVGSAVLLPTPITVFANQGAGQGSPNTNVILINPIGFHNQPNDWVLGQSLYGNGYRRYSSGIGLFTQYDRDIGAFGPSGGNGFIFCSHDVFNRFDPDGRLDIGMLVGGIVLAVVSVVSIVATVATAGAATPVAVTVMGVASGVLATASAATSIAAAVIDDPTNTHYNNLTQASKWLGVASAAVGLVAGVGGAMSSGAAATGASTSLKTFTKASKASKVGVAFDAVGLVGMTTETSAMYVTDPTAQEVLSKVGYNLGLIGRVGSLGTFISEMPSNLHVSNKYMVDGVGGVQMKGSRVSSNSKTPGQYTGKTSGSTKLKVASTVSKNLINSTRVLGSLGQRINTNYIAEPSASEGAVSDTAIPAPEQQPVPMDFISPQQEIRKLLI